MAEMAPDADWLRGKRIAFTGRLATMTRKEVASLVATFGGKMVPTVGPRTAFVVIGQDGWPLQDDGRLTNQELANLVGLSASQCSRRRMRLEEERIIAGYRAELSGEALGFNLIAFINITLATHSPDNAKKFRTLINRVDDVQEAYSLTGDADYVLKAVLRDLKDLSNLVNNVLMPHPSVAHVRSSIVLDRLKESSKLPLKT